MHRERYRLKQSHALASVSSIIVIVLLMFGVTTENMPQSIISPSTTWTFDSLSGTTVNSQTLSDNSTSMFCGTAFAAAFACPAPLTEAGTTFMRFSGAQYLGTTIALDSNSMTIRMRVRTAQATGGLMSVVSSFVLATIDHDRELYFENGKVCSRVWAPGEEIICTVGTYNDNAWHVIERGFVAGQTAHYLKVDNETVYGTTQSVAAWNPVGFVLGVCSRANTSSCGSSGDNTYFTGDIDYLTIAPVVAPAISPTASATTVPTQAATAQRTASAPTTLSRTSTATYTPTVTTSQTPTTNPSNTFTRTPITQSQATSSGLGPVIFVPGIMGSYLDYINPNDNNKVCNIWPTSHQDLISINGCKGVNWQEGHRDLLLQLTNTNIYATDAIRNQEHVGSYGDAYIHLMNRLNSTWPEYRGDNSLFAKTSIDRCNSIKEKVNQNEIARNQTLLYAFGYDWRQTTKYNAAKLSEFIDCVRSTHNNAKISLVGHSMGGLVIKQLLLNYKDSSSIANVSTFNTPYLGAVRAIKIMGDGEYDRVSQHILEAPFLKEVAKNVPGAIELLPANLYLQKYPCRLVVNGNAACNDSEYWDRISTAFGNQAKNYQLADSVGRDDTGEIVERTKGINYLIQFSPNKNTTVAQVKKNGSNWSSDMGAGDGTVNEFSLTRYLPSDVDWNPKTTSMRRVVTVGFCNQGINHTGLAQNNTAIGNLILFLKNPAEFRKNEPNTTCVNGDIVQMSGDTNSEDTNFTKIMPEDFALSFTGRWPELSWQYPMTMDSALRSAFYIEVAKIDADWNNPAVIPDVYECVSIRNFAGKYTIPAESFMAQRQGTYKWRVRLSAVNMSNPQACRDANRGAKTGWMPYRRFTSFGIETLTPASQDKSFVTAFTARTIQESWKNYTNSFSFLPTKIQYRLEIKQGNQVFYSPCKDTPVFNMQDYPSIFTNLLKYDGVATYTFEALYTFVPNGVINCNPLAFYPSKWRGYPRTFTMATKPVLLAPATDTLTTDGRWPQLSWQPFGGVAGVVAPFGYRVQVSRSSDFSKDLLLVDECTIATTYRPDNDGWMAERYGKLFWRVTYVPKAWTDKNVCRDSIAVVPNAWSEVRTFSNQVPANRVVAVAPLNGTNTSDGGWPELQWANGDYMQTRYGYRIQVTNSSDVNFANPIVDQCTLTRSYKPDDQWWAQANTGTFLWRVNYMQKQWYTSSNRITDDTKRKCRDVSDGVNNSLWSITRTFINTPSSKSPQLISPANASQSTNGMWVPLKWVPNANVSTQYGYRIQVSTDRNFQDGSKMVVNECRMNPEYIANPPEWTKGKTGTFHWRVNYAKKAWNQNNPTSCKNDLVTESLWSEVRTFSNQVPANRVVIISPDSGFRSSNGRWPVLKWQAGPYMTAPHGYRIQVSRSEDFSSFIVDECRNATEYVSGNVGWESGYIGKLYWRINYVSSAWASKDACKNQPTNGQTWSTTRWFENAIFTPTFTRTRTPVATPTSSPRPTDASLTKPNLKRPSNGSSGVSTTVELDWDDVTRGDVNRYEVEICVETRNGSNSWKCAKYDTNGAESRWRVMDRTGKIFPQRLIKWKVNANDGTKDGPESDWWYFHPRYTTVSSMSTSSSKIKFSLSRESNGVNYECKYNFEGYKSDGSWSSKGKASVSGSSCEFSIDSMRSKGASRGTTIYLTVTSDSGKTLGGFDGRENTDGGYIYTFRMP